MAGLDPAPAPPLSEVLGVPVRPQPVPARPDIQLHLVSAEADLDLPLRNLWELPQAPYWAFCWGAGQALAHYLGEHAHLVRACRVVDFGAGSGIAAIAAAKAGAARVVAVDRDPHARAACQANAQLNGVHLEVRDAIPDELDVLLAADILYEPYNLDDLERWIDSDRRVLLAVPERPRTPPVLYEPAARLAVRTFPDVDPPVEHAHIYEIG